MWKRMKNQILSGFCRLISLVVLEVYIEVCLDGKVYVSLMKHVNDRCLEKDKNNLRRGQER